MLCLATLAFAAQAGAPQRIPESDEAGWRAVGRLDVAGGASCTATLISDRVALTAAHCVADRVTGDTYAPVKMTLRAGLRYGRAAGAQRATAVATWPRDAARDPCAAGLAAIAFPAPFNPDRIAPFETGDAPLAGRLAMVGYGGASPGAPALAEECALTDEAGALRASDCKALPGAALIAEVEGRRVVLGVVSADARCGADAERVVAVGPHLSDLLGALAEAAR